MGWPMMTLFGDGELRSYLDDRRGRAVTHLEQMPEEEVLARSVDSLVEELTVLARVEPLVLHADEPVCGQVQELDIERDGRNGRRVHVQGVRIRSEYAFEGDANLFRLRPSTYNLRGWAGAVGEDTLAIYLDRAGVDQDPGAVQQALNEEIRGIAGMARNASNDVEGYNSRLGADLRPAVEARRQRLLSKRNLAGALGFPLVRHSNAPRRVPIERKVLGLERRQASRPALRRTYEDEVAIADADYEDVIGVLRSTLLSCERAPSTLTDKSEEAIRDLLLIQLNGTFRGSATGETFVNHGKTDILVRIDDRHVFVGECKWWKGPAGFIAACDQLLSYLPWRDEKAALVIFIKNKNATALIDVADKAMRGYKQFVRAGQRSDDPSSRRDYVLRHGDDPDREIRVAVLFAVIADSDPAAAS